MVVHLFLLKCSKSAKPNLYLVLQCRDLLRELGDELRVLGLTDPGHHQVLLHPGLEVGVLALRFANLHLKKLTKIDFRAV